MEKRIVLIDAVRFITEEIDRVFSEVIPDAELIHIVDEGILKFDAENKQLKRRFCSLVVAAEEIGADVIVITCAHGIPSLNIVQTLVDPPVVQITLPMIEAAVNIGETIGLVSTEETIVKPMVRLLERAGEQANRRVTVKVGFQARLFGDTARHDELVMKTIEDISKTVDVVVLAQISLGRVVPKVKGKIDRPILSPLIIAAEKIKTMLKRGDKNGEKNP
jgi:Asp/Glu/hydantoin racemase